MDKAINYRKARRQVERKLGFYIHLSVYLAVNSGLIMLNVLLASAKPWAVFPLLGWGIGLLFHGLAVFLHASGSAWKQRMIDNELKKQLPAKTE